MAAKKTPPPSDALKETEMPPPSTEVSKTAKPRARKKSASPSSISAGFKQYLSRIKSAKSAADKLFESAESTEPLSAPRASLALLWELVFDHLCAGTELSVSDFNTLAGVVQKLAASRVQIENADERQSRASRGTTGGISQEMLKNIEEQLKLL